MKNTKYIVLCSVLATGLGACGGAQKAGGSGGDGAVTDQAADAPPPPGMGAEPEKIDRAVTADAKKDFGGAIAFYQDKAKEGWTPGNCEAAADKFLDVASSHDKMVEAYFNAGRAYHNCGQTKQAEEQYQRALKVSASHAKSLEALGEIYYRGGNEQRASQYWQRAVKANPKTEAARNNLAWTLIQKMGRTSDKRAWQKYEDEAKGHLSRVLAVNTENVEAYVLYALLYMQGSERNRNRLDLAKLLLEEGAKRDANYPPLWNARGLLFLKRNNVGSALSSFEKAVELAPEFAEAQLNVGNIVLDFRRYDYAKTKFEAVVKLEPENYDALVGLGIAQRGLGDLDAAEASYEKAKKIDQKRPDSVYNLGVLYKDFRATRAADEKATIDAYKTAKIHFQQVLGKSGLSKSQRRDVQDNIEDIDKAVKMLEQAIEIKKQMEQQQAQGGQG